MKKTVIIVILLAYLASILVVQFFGLKVVSEVPAVTPFRIAHITASK